MLPAVARSSVRVMRRAGARALSASGSAAWKDDSPLPEFTLLRPPQRESEPDDVKRKRLLYQSRKRGIVENDLILGTFAKKHLDTLAREDLSLYDDLLGENDWDIFYWATGVRQVPPPYAGSPLFDKIQQVARNTERVVMRLPELNN